MSRLVLAFALAGCGRVAFSSQTDAGNDRTPPDAFQCAVAATAPDPVMIAGSTFTYIGFNNQTMGVDSVDVYALAGDVVIAQTTSDGNGNYTLAVPTGGEPRQFEIELSRDGYLSTFVILDQPLDHDVTALNMSVWALGDGPLWSGASLDTVYRAPTPQVVRDEALGTVNIAVRACGDQPLDGASVTVSPMPPRLFYLKPDGTPAPDPLTPDMAPQTSTVLPYTHAIGLNVPVGTMHISASAAGRHFVDQDIRVRGGVDTLAIVHSAE